MRPFLGNVFQPPHYNLDEISFGIGLPGEKKIAIAAAAVVIIKAGSFIINTKWADFTQKISDYASRIIILVGAIFAAIIAVGCARGLLGAAVIDPGAKVLLQGAYLAMEFGGVAILARETKKYFSPKSPI